MKRVPVFVFASLSPLLFPFPLTVIASFVASLLWVPFGLLMGIVTDILYWAPGGGLPVGTSIGVAVTLIAFLVRKFTKARIMSS